ncbi:MAG TPA: tRNA (adenosine(37)-N6)-dimethylallyltransferase MiaA [Nevskiales bacterium]|nr:tRNA (adenosine(37)-N6)-dimethylallyltransferase MiaA [Nevskiales bacterium]
MGTAADARPPVVFLMGPTASGKTDLAVALTQSLPFDIVSVDSAMVYRGMDIGTAKPSPEVLVQAPHRLIDICDPAETYSAARFRADALREIAAIHAQGRIPLLVGGTMLYFRALRAGLSSLPSAAPELRARLSAEAAAVGWPELHRRLAVRDPGTAARIHPNDAQRIQRALEIVELTGATPSELYAAARPTLPWPVHLLALAPPSRERLWERLAQRFHGMMARGFLAEVARLRARGDLSPELPSMRAVGYRQLWLHLDGHFSLDEAVSRAIYASRQYAKRQLTWLRREAVDAWFDSDTLELARQVRQYLDRAGLVG